MRKHPVSIALSKRILERIDQEAAKANRKRSDWIERHFDDLFFSTQAPKAEIAIKTG